MKYLAVESDISLGEALVGAKRYPQARQGVQRALARSEKLGLPACRRGATTCWRPRCDTSGSAADASRHLTEARRILEEIRKEAKTDEVVKRADLAPILAEAR